MLIRVQTAKGEFITQNRFLAKFYESCYEGVEIIENVSSNTIIENEAMSESIFSENSPNESAFDFVKVFGTEISSNESLHIYSYNSLGTIQNDETFWLIEGRIALGRILVQLLLDDRNQLTHSLFTIAVGEIRNHMETHSQFLLTAYLKIIEGLVNRLMGNFQSPEDLMHVYSLLEWTGIIDQSELTGDLINKLKSAATILEQETKEDVLINELEGLLRFNWIILLNTNPKLIPPPDPPMESISVSRDTLTLFGIDARSGSSTSTLLGTFISALSELVKEIYDETEWLEDVWFETGRILNFHYRGFSFTLLGRTIQKIQDMRLIAFATNVIKTLEHLSDQFIDDRLDEIFKNYSYHFFGLGSPSNDRTEPKEIYPEELNDLPTFTGVADIIIFDNGDFQSQISKVPYVSSRVLICRHPDEIDPQTYLNYSFIGFTEQTPEIQMFVDAISFLNPAIEIKKLTIPNPLTTDFLLNLLWKANMAKRAKIKHFLLEKRGGWLSDFFSNKFETLLKSYRANLNNFFMEIMKVDISFLLKKRIVRELPSVINYYFNIVRLSFERLDEIGFDSVEFPLIHERVVAAIQTLETIAIRYGQKLLHTYVLFIKGIYYTRIGEPDVGRANLKGCKDLIKWHILNGRNYDIIQVLNFFLKNDDWNKMSNLGQVHSLIRKSIEDLLIFSPTLFGVTEKEKTADLFIKYKDSLVFQSSIREGNHELISVLVDHFLLSINGLVAEIRKSSEEINAIFFRDSVIFIEQIGEFKVILFSTPRKKNDKLAFQTLLISLSELLESGLEEGRLIKEKEVLDVFHSLY